MRRLCILAMTAGASQLKDGTHSTTSTYFETYQGESSRDASLSRSVAKLHVVPRSHGSSKIPRDKRPEVKISKKRLLALGRDVATADHLGRIGKVSKDDRTPNNATPRGPEPSSSYRFPDLPSLGEEQTGAFRGGKNDPPATVEREVWQKGACGVGSPSEYEVALDEASSNDGDHRPKPASLHIENPDTVLSIEEITQKHIRRPTLSIPTSFSSHKAPPVPPIPFQHRPAQEAIPSIDDIISQHRHQLRIPLPRFSRATSAPAPDTTRSAFEPVAEESELESRASVDSVTREVMHRISHAPVWTAPPPMTTRTLHHARSQPSLSSTSYLPAPPRRRQESLCSASYSQIDSSDAMPSPASSLCNFGPQLGCATSGSLDLAAYLRSTRLTRLLILRRPPNHGLTVSLADLGMEDGHPVLVFLGLGCVRYLVALYDELASSLGLRLICIDRWGLGKTAPVPDECRGFLEWASVVEEVLDQLQIRRFSVIAHSAGAPYALATSLRLNDRVHGSINLLAPWVIGSDESLSKTSYRWLRFIPSSVLKTAQAAEWKMQSWKLGKPLSLTSNGIGFDPEAPVSHEDATSPVFASALSSQQLEHCSDNDDDHGFLQPPLSRTVSPDASTPPAKDANAVPLRKLSKGFLNSVRFAQPSNDSSSIARRTQAVRRSSSFSAASTMRRSEASSGVGVRSAEPNIKLGTALLRASHAESLKGGTSDLITILGRTSKSAGFSYSEVERPVKVWHGLKDEKISLNTVLELERTMQDCQVTVIPEADHSLMTNVPVFRKVLDSIAGEWK